MRCNFGVSAGEFYRLICRVVYVINIALNIKFDVSEVDNLRCLEQGFAAKSRLNAISGAIDLLDGCLLWQCNPEVAVEIQIDTFA